MIFEKSRGFVVRLVSVALVCAGFAQASFGSVVGTDYVLESEHRAQSIERVSAFLSRADVARQLADHGVDQASIDARLAGLTDAELAVLDGRIGDEVAGGDALAVIGTVFLVLLILELVGVTDIFKSV